MRISDLRISMNIRKIRWASRLPALAASFLLGGLAVQGQTFQTVLNTNLFQPAGVGVSPLNHYIISDTIDNRIVEFNSDNRSFSVLAGPSSAPFLGGAVDGSPVDAQFRNPQGIVALSDRVIVADTGNHLIRSVSYDGFVTTIAGNISLAHQADEIEGTPQNAGFTDGAALSAAFNAPSGLAYDGNGHLYIADSGNRAIRMLDFSNNTVSTILATGLTRPMGVAVGNAGKLYIADAGANSIKTYTPGDAGPTLLAGSGSMIGRGFRNSSIATNALFSAPSGVYYHAFSDDLIVADTGNSVLRVVQKASSASPSVGTFAKTDTAGMQSPVAVTRDNFGVYLVVDPPRNALSSIITSIVPRIQPPVIGVFKIIQDPNTLAPVAINDAVTQRVFNNEVTVIVTGDPNAEHFFTSLVTTNPLSDVDVPLPSTNSTPVPYTLSLPQSPPPPAPSQFVSPVNVLKIKAFSAPRGADERVPSQVTEATFIFRAATPVLDSTTVPGSLVLQDETENARIFYTLDDSEPDPTINPNAIGPKKAGDIISLVVATNKLVVKAKAFRNNFLDSSTARAEFTPENFIPNRISLGFESGEASSRFIAAAGQRFYAPVTLSVIPGTKAYGLQFNLQVQPGTAPTNDLELGFDSRLVELLPDGFTRVIRPQSFDHPELTVTNFFLTNANGSITIIPVTNTISVFTNLLFTNHTQNLLGVGWVERFKATNLYDTFRQTLISYSQPHDTLFESAQGEVVAGAFSILIPPGTEPSTNAYTLRVDRPSATGDGVSRDVYILVADESYAERYRSSKLRSYRPLTIGNPGYIVGDVAPFQWYNAGDFGDTNILNNDITQLQQTIVYGWNTPPLGSDLVDSMDSCCVTTNGVDLSSSPLGDGADLDINKIGLGDGKLEINDLFVSFRRGLDPSLVWYYRYWSNGVRHATVINNSYRGSANSLRAQSISATSIPTQPSIPSPDPSSLTLSAGTAVGHAGETVNIPIRAHVAGGYPLRTLMFNLTVQTVDGAVHPDTSLSFTPLSALGAPTVEFNSEPGHYGAAWLSTESPGVLGDVVIGTVQFTVPETATPDSLFLIKLDRVSGSPNGITLFPMQSGNGLVAMADRPALAMNDSIPDSWRIQYFGSATDPRSYPAVDADGDGLSNFQEYKLGTNPLDPSDSLKVHVQPSGTGAVKLKFHTASGKRYLIEKSASLVPGSWSIYQSDVLGTGGDIELPGSSGGAQSYYRVRLQE